MAIVGPTFRIQANWLQVHELGQQDHIHGYPIDDPSSDHLLELNNRVFMSFHRFTQGGSTSPQGA